jgi:hypothetical protein
MKKTFNDAALNAPREGMEKVFDRISVFEKEGRTTAYVFDWTPWSSRAALSAWVKDSYDVDAVVYGDNPKNLFNQLSAPFTKAPEQNRGTPLYQGEVFLPSDKKPLALRPEIAFATPSGLMI